MKRFGNENKNVDPKRVVESFQLRLLSQLRHSRGPCFSKCRGASAARAGSCWQRRQDGGFPGSHRLRPRLSVQEPHHLRLKGNGRVMDSVQLSPNVGFAWFQASVWMSIIHCIEPGRFTIVTLLSHSMHSRRIEPVRGEGSGTRVPGQTGP